MAPYSESLDREIRRSANEAKGKWFYDHMNEFDEIYDKMVKVRTRMAKKLGYENYVQLGFDKLGRTDYTPADVKNYREQTFDFLRIKSYIFNRTYFMIELDVISINRRFL